MAGVEAQYVGYSPIRKSYDVLVKSPDGYNDIKLFDTEKEAKNYVANAKLERTPEADTFGAPKKKSIGKGIASAFIPGLGQAIDGRFKDGLKDYAKNFGWVVGGTAAGLAGYNSFVKAVEAGGKTPYGFYAGMALAALATIGFVANRVHSVVDAYNGGKN